MSAPEDRNPPLEYVASSSGRRKTKKLQNISLAQLVRPGIAHHVQPGSAAATLNRQRAEQRREAWLGGEKSSASADASQSMAKGKGKSKRTIAEEEKPATATGAETNVLQQISQPFSASPAREDVAAQKRREMHSRSSDLTDPVMRFFLTPIRMGSTQFAHALDRTGA